MAESIVTEETVYLNTWTGVQKATKRTTRTPVSNYVDRVEYIGEDGRILTHCCSYSTLAKAKAIVRARLEEEIENRLENIAAWQRDIEGYREKLAALEAMTDDPA